ncbi:MAG: HAD family hydrolase [Candidatus Edwardsbacteria bacterium]|nr:HAD family hydrolase [Candidatus Edwardsbacteria bacterium]
MNQFITFDLWETLIADSPELDGSRAEYRVKNIHSLLSQMQPGIDINDIYRAHEKTWQECSVLWEKARDLAFPDQVRLFVGLIGGNLLTTLNQRDFQTIAEAYSGAVLQFRPRLIAGARETLAQLAYRGCKMGLICNTGRTPGFILRKLLEDYDILRYFNSALFSDETIIRKPDAAIFETALRELGADRGQTVHVGDSWENDILGARASGIRTVWVSPQGQGPGGCPVIKSVAELPEALDKI